MEREVPEPHSFHSYSAQPIKETERIINLSTFKEGSRGPQRLPPDTDRNLFQGVQFFLDMKTPKSGTSCNNWLKGNKHKNDLKWHKHEGTRRQSILEGNGIFCFKILNKIKSQET